MALNYYNPELKKKHSKPQSRKQKQNKKNKKNQLGLFLNMVAWLAGPFCHLICNNVATVHGYIIYNIKYFSKHKAPKTSIIKSTSFQASIFL